MRVPVLFCLLLTSGCTGRPDVPPAPIAPPLGALAVEHVPEPPPTFRAAGALVPRQGIYAVMVPPTDCARPPGAGLPMVTCRGVGPVVGVPHVIDVHVSDQPASGDDAPCWLAVSWGPDVRVDAGPFGAPGCWLLVAWDSMLPCLAGTATDTVQRPAGSACASIRWVPPAAAAGQILRVQPIVMRPWTQAGLVSGWALALGVGAG